MSPLSIFTKEEEMFLSFVRSAIRGLSLLVLNLAFLPVILSAPALAAGPVAHPLISDWQFLASGTTPPGQAACNAVGRRCFNPAAMQNSYNYATLLAAGNKGQGKTIAIVDSFGSSTIRNDLGVFSTAFGLPHLCGDSGPSTPAGNCPSGNTPRFDILEVQGSPSPNPPPPNNSFGQEN